MVKLLNVFCGHFNICATSRLVSQPVSKILLPINFLKVIFLLTSWWSVDGLVVVVVIVVVASDNDDSYLFYF